MSRYEVLREFDNMGFRSAGRAFPGFAKRGEALLHRIAPRQGQMHDMRPGDLLSLSLTAGVTAQIVAFGPGGQPALDSLGLAAHGTLQIADCDADALIGWIAGQGGTCGDLPACTITGQPEPLVLRARDRVSVWVFRPVTPAALVTGDLTGQLHLTLQPAPGNDPLLPPLLGDTRDEFTVPRATAMAYELKKGEFLQIIDVEGQQCSDFTAFRADGLHRGEELMIDGTVTRSMVRRAYPGPGLLDKFYDRDMTPLLKVVQDTCGRHDTFGLACTARGYEERGFPGHVNCSDNISEVLAPYGVAVARPGRRSTSSGTPGSIPARITS